MQTMIAKSPSKPRIYIQPEIIGAGKFVHGRRAPEARSCNREGRRIRRNALKSLVLWKENHALPPGFPVAPAGAFHSKCARLAHKRALCRGPHAEERRPTRHLEGEFRERPRRRLLAASEAIFDAVSRRRTRFVETE